MSFSRPPAVLALLLSATSSLAADVSTSTVLVPGGTSGVALADTLGDHPSLRSFATPSHPLHMDGSTDDAPVIQAAIDYYCSLPYGGNIVVPNGLYAQGSEIDQPCSNVHLVGPGTGAYTHDVNQSHYTDVGATFRWIGPSGGKQLVVGPPSQTTYPNAVQGVSNADVTGIQFDGNHGLAAYGLVVQSVRFSRFQGQSQEHTGAGLLMTTAEIGETNDTQQNDVDWTFSNFSTAGVGVLCSATPSAALPAAEEHGNCSNNHFRNLVGLMRAAPGVVFGFSDHNTVDNVGCINASPKSSTPGRFTTPCLVFQGGPNTNDVAYANAVRLASGGDVVSQGTDTSGVVGPALYNAIGQLDPADFGFVTVGTGSKMSWATDAGNFFGNRGFGTDTPAYPLDVQGEARASALHVGFGADPMIYDAGGGQLTFRAGTGSHDTYFSFDGSGVLKAPGIAAGNLVSATAVIPGLTATGVLVIPFGTPASSSATCTRGQIEFDSSYLYTCVATDTWHRARTGSAW